MFLVWEIILAGIWEDFLYEEHMRIELQFNQVVMSQGELDSIVGLVTVPSGYLLPAHRKPVKRRGTKKGCLKVGTVIQGIIEEVK